ncbi:MAG TPA: hypothetical protein DEA08_07010 [Planctomycetes bacterium]|nr:hypothetical protein [Planctomycetota bacterium]
MKRTLTLFLATLLATGCLEREETIRVSPEGALAIEHQLRGDRGDLDGGAASYPQAGTWQVARSTRTKADGKVEHVLSAKGEFARAADVPTRFAGPQAAGALELSTDLELRPGDEGTTYVFERTYAPRRWAPYERFHQQAFPAEVQALFKQLSRFAELSAADKGRLVGALRRYESDKASRWVSEGAVKAAPDSARLAEARLAIAAAVRARVEGAVDATFVAQALANPAGIEARASELQAAVERAGVEAARDVLALTPEQVARLRGEIGQQRRSFEVSEDLADEAFVVRLRLPGRVLAHNGDALEGSTVVWRFNGKDLRDRRQRLLAKSFLPAGD